MKKSSLIMIGCLLTIVMLGQRVSAQSGDFSYQGSLNNGGTAASGNYDFEFALFDAQAGGLQLGSTNTRSGVLVTNGLFAVLLNFGGSFSGPPRFLEIRVRPSGAGSFTTLNPRQPITSTPYAIQALHADTADRADTATVAGTANSANTANTANSAATATTATTATTAATAGNFTGSLSGDISGTQGATVVNTVGGQTATSVANAAAAVSTATSVNNSNTLIRRDGSGSFSANVINAAQFNIGGNRVLSVNGSANLFAGVGAGSMNSGSANSFVGESAGNDNTTGSANSFFGFGAGEHNIVGNNNAFFGVDAGTNNTASNNAFFGRRAGIQNTTGADNAFFGYSAGYNNDTADFNSFFGNSAGIDNTTGSNNSFFGANAGDTNISGSNNTVIGSGADVNVNGVNFGTAIGAGAIVTVSNRVQLGRNGTDSVRIGTLISDPFAQVCINASNVLSSCASSRRYKENIQGLAHGLDLLARFRPVTFVWKASQRPDLGLIAEEVAEIEPHLVTHNQSGEIEGVRYDLISVVLINAVKEQQVNITNQNLRIDEQQKLIEAQRLALEDANHQLLRQRQELDALRTLVCSQNPVAELCRGKAQ